MSTALAVVVERIPDGALTGRIAYAILDGPEAGGYFYASDPAWWLVGQVVTVTYYPADQYARRVRA